MFDIEFIRINNKKRSKNKPNKTKDRFKYLIRLELSNGDAFS